MRTYTIDQLDAKAIATITKHLTDMVAYTIGYIEELLSRYQDTFPRTSELKAFDEVDARAAALSNLTVCFHRESGFIGHRIKAEMGSCEMECQASEYDRLLLIFKDGLYKVVPMVDKFFVGSDLYWMGVVENDTVFNLLYRNGPDNLVYIKRFLTPKFILNREYRLFEPDRRSSILFLQTGKEGVRVRVSLMPAARAKYNALEVDFGETLIKGVSAIGKRLSTRKVRRITDISGKKTPQDVEAAPLPLPGMDPENQD